MATGGSIESTSIGGREFTVAGDADSSRDLGGFTIEFQPNGNGTAREIKTRKPWQLTGLTIEIDDSRGDQEYLQNIMDSGDIVAIGITYVTGETYQGQGKPSGDLQASSASATADVTLSGPQKLSRQ